MHLQGAHLDRGDSFQRPSLPAHQVPGEETAQPGLPLFGAEQVNPAPVVKQGAACHPAQSRQPLGKVGAAPGVRSGRRRLGALPAAGPVAGRVRLLDGRHACERLHPRDDAPPRAPPRQDRVPGDLRVRDVGRAAMPHQVVEQEGVPGPGEKLSRGPGILRQGHRILCRLPVLLHQAAVAPGRAGKEDEGAPAGPDAGQEEEAADCPAVGHQGGVGVVYVSGRPAPFRLRLVRPDHVPPARLAHRFVAGARTARRQRRSGARWRRRGSRGGRGSCRCPPPAPAAPRRSFRERRHRARPRTRARGSARGPPRTGPSRLSPAPLSPRKGIHPFAAALHPDSGISRPRAQWAPRQYSLR